MSAIAECPKRVEVRMKVVEHDMGSWYLLSDEKDFYLDIRTGLFGYGFWLLMKLNQEESDGYRWGETDYVIALAKIVQLRAQSYFLRNEPVEKQRIAFAAVEEWQKNLHRQKPPL